MIYVVCGVLLLCLVMFVLLRGKGGLERPRSQSTHDSSLKFYGNKHG